MTPGARSAHDSTPPSRPSRPNGLGGCVLLCLGSLSCGEGLTETPKTTPTGDSATIPSTTEDCRVTLTLDDTTGASAIYVAGTFNDWDRLANPLTRDGTRWTVELELDAGAWPYKFVKVYDDGAGSLSWACDPNADAIQCDEGYTWDPSCNDGAACNSLLLVEECGRPSLTVSDLHIDREALSLAVTLTVTGAPVDLWATLDGADVTSALVEVDGGFRFEQVGLSAGRHTFRAGASDALGGEIEPVYVPAWLDSRRWDSGLLYFVFVDRFANGDSGLDGSEGATATGGDFEGGDWQGVIDRLDELDALGVTALWLTAALQNAGGAFDGRCGATYSAYHGYWVTDPAALEEHFGDEATFSELIAAAHARNIRVLVDAVANQLHQDHPYVSAHPEWFSPMTICEEDEDGNGVTNWDQRPETCWFDDYLPDVNYYDAGALTAMVEDTVDFVKTWGVDGYRVDAVKHMPHSFHYNLSGRLATEVEHLEAGGDEDFYMVGETFSGDRGLILSYVDDHQLDGQFDFPLYWAIVAAFARNEIGLSSGDGSLASVAAASQSEFAGHLMSTFLGNHDVVRFINQANGEVASLYGDATCDSDGTLREPAQSPSSSVPYERLRLAWTFLLTQPGLPLVYYGDELGLPGLNDPDNRQMMRFDAERSADEQATWDHVAALGQARRAHPALSSASGVEWWGGEADFYAYTRVADTEAALVLLNRAVTSRTVENGLGWAGLPEGAWTDLLTGDVFNSNGDRLTVEVPGRGSRVLVRGI